MSINNPSSPFPYIADEAFAVNQPAYISGDGFFLYSKGISSTGWGQFDITPSVKLNAVDYNGAGVALLAGNSGVIVKHSILDSDSSTVKIQVLDSTINFRDVSFYSSTEAVAVGDSGSIYRTSNYGDTWTKVIGPVITQLNAVTFSTGSDWWICGNAGTVITSSNVGSTWFQFPTSPNFIQLNSAAAPPYSSSINATLYDFYDIKYAEYVGPWTTVTNSFFIYVVGSSGSVFANYPFDNVIANTNLVFSNKMYDISLNYMLGNSAHTSSIYNKVLYTNENYFYANQKSSGSFGAPVNVSIGGTNGKLLTIEATTTTNTDGPSALFDKINTPTLSYVTRSLFTDNITSGVLKPVIYPGYFSGYVSTIYLQQQFYVTTDTGKLIQLNYPSDTNGNFTSQSTAYSFNTPTQSFGGSLTDIDASSANELYNNVYVKLTLDRNLPDASGSDLWYGNSGGDNLTTQGMRIYRPFRGENFVTLNENMPDGTGFLIPEDYDPKFNYLEIAKKAGLV